MTGSSSLLRKTLVGAMRYDSAHSHALQTREPLLVALAARLQAVRLGRGCSCLLHFSPSLHYSRFFLYCLYFT